MRGAETRCSRKLRVRCDLGPHWGFSRCRDLPVLKWSTNRHRDTESSPKLEKAPDEKSNMQHVVALRKKPTRTSTAYKQQLLIYCKSVTRNPHPHLWSHSSILTDDWCRGIQWKEWPVLCCPWGKKSNPWGPDLHTLVQWLHTCLLPLFGLWFWCFTSEEQV